MVIYNVTVKIDADVQDDWKDWMITEHIPEVLATGCFLGYKICRLLDQDDHSGITYAIQYLCSDLNAYQQYAKEYAASLQEKHTNRYNGKYAAFRTLMKVEHSSD